MQRGCTPDGRLLADIVPALDGPPAARVPIEKFAALLSSKDASAPVMTCRLLAHVVSRVQLELCDGGRDHEVASGSVTTQALIEFTAHLANTLMMEALLCKSGVSASLLQLLNAWSVLACGLRHVFDPFLAQKLLVPCGELLAALHTKVTEGDDATKARAAELAGLDKRFQALLVRARSVTATAKQSFVFLSCLGQS